MTRPRIGQLLAKLDKLLDRYVDSGPGAADLAACRAFVWDGGRMTLRPIARPVRIDPQDLIGIDDVKQAVLQNTRNFVDGRRANNILLWGERGTGKSSLVKSLLFAFSGTNLRVIQVRKHDILTVPDLFDLVAPGTVYRFILFIDDLSFEEHQTDYKEMKAIMDGGLEAMPENILFYATSNRKHIIPEKFSDNDSDEIRPSDTVEEKISLADRFGLRFGFYHLSQETYIEIVASYAAKYGISMKKELLDRQAIQWALAAGGRNGRIAEQFVRTLPGGGPGRQGDTQPD